jgi:predicted nucleic acid-binding protein
VTSVFTVVNAFKTPAGKWHLLGGTIYEALLAKCALKANATIIYTWDVDQFRRLGSEVARRVRTP